MKRLVFILKKKFFGKKEASLDLVLKYLKDHNHIDSERWLFLPEGNVRIGRTSLDVIVIPALENINHAVSRYLPEFKAFEIKRSEWRRDKYHKVIIKNPDVKIVEDERNYYIEVEVNGESEK